MKNLRTSVQEANFIVTGIIILNFNNSSQTLNCLESLYAHCKGVDFSICVVPAIQNLAEEWHKNPTHLAVRKIFF